MNETLNYAGEHFTCQEEDRVAVFAFHSDVFEVGTDLSQKGEFFSLLSKADRASHIGAILIMNASGSLSEESYGQFLNTMLAEAIDRTDREMLLSREEYAIGQFIAVINRCRKVVIAGLQGSITATFLGVALAYDYRIAAEDVVFTLSHETLDMPPSGALGFFLPRYVGMGKAMDLVLSERAISAQEAFDMNLVNQVFSCAEFDQLCRERAQQLANLSYDVANTKALLYAHTDDELDDYLNKEFQIMHQVWSAKKDTFS